jgi:hypothetical protein
MALTPREDRLTQLLGEYGYRPMELSVHGCVVTATFAGGVGVRTVEASCSAGLTDATVASDLIIIMAAQAGIRPLRHGRFARDSAKTKRNLTST